MPRKYQKDASLVPKGFYTRTALMRTTGMNETDVYRLEAMGHLKADDRNKRGWWLYSQAQVDYVKSLIVNGAFLPKNRVLATAVKKDAGESPDPKSFSSEIMRERRLARAIIGEITPGMRAPEPQGVAQSIAMSSVTGRQQYTIDEGHRVFAGLKEGKTLIDIFFETKIHPLIINAIAEDYAQMSSSILLTKNVVDALNTFEHNPEIDGSFPIRNSTDAFQVMMSALKITAVKKCQVCKGRPADTCQRCVEKHMTKKMQDAVTGERLRVSREVAAAQRAALAEQETETHMDSLTPPNVAPELESTAAE